MHAAIFSLMMIVSTAFAQHGGAETQGGFNGQSTVTGLDGQRMEQAMFRAGIPEVPGSDKSTFTTSSGPIQCTRLNGTLVQCTFDNDPAPGHVTLVSAGKGVEDDEASQLVDAVSEMLTRMGGKTEDIQGLGPTVHVKSMQCHGDVNNIRNTYCRASL